MRVTGITGVNKALRSGLGRFSLALLALGICGLTFGDEPEKNPFRLWGKQKDANHDALDAKWGVLDDSGSGCEKYGAKSFQSDALLRHFRRIWKGSSEFEPLPILKAPPLPPLSDLKTKGKAQLLPALKLDKVAEPEKERGPLLTFEKEEGKRSDQKKKRLDLFFNRCDIWEGWNSTSPLELSSLPPLQKTRSRPSAFDSAVTKQEKERLLKQPLVVRTGKAKEAKGKQLALPRIELSPSGIMSRLVAYVEAAERCGDLDLIALVKSELAAMSTPQARRKIAEAFPDAAGPLLFGIGELAEIGESRTFGPWYKEAFPMPRLEPRSTSKQVVRKRDERQGICARKVSEVIPTLSGLATKSGGWVPRHLSPFAFIETKRGLVNLQLLLLMGECSESSVLAKDLAAFHRVLSAVPKEFFTESEIRELESHSKKVNACSSVEELLRLTSQLRLDRLSDRVPTATDEKAAKKSGEAQRQVRVWSQEKSPSMEGVGATDSKSRTAGSEREVEEFIRDFAVSPVASSLGDPPLPAKGAEREKLRTSLLKWLADDDYPIGKVSVDRRSLAKARARAAVDHVLSRLDGMMDEKGERQSYKGLDAAPYHLIARSLDDRTENKYGQADAQRISEKLFDTEGVGVPAPARWQIARMSPYQRKWLRHEAGKNSAELKKVIGSITPDAVDERILTGLPLIGDESGDCDKALVAKSELWQNKMLSPTRAENLRVLLRDGEKAKAWSREAWDAILSYAAVAKDASKLRIPPLPETFSERENLREEILTELGTREVSQTVAATQVRRVLAAAIKRLDRAPDWPGDNSLVNIPYCSLARQSALKLETSTKAAKEDIQRIAELVFEKHRRGLPAQSRYVLASLPSFSRKWIISRLELGDTQGQYDRALELAVYPSQEEILRDMALVADRHKTSAHGKALTKLLRQEVGETETDAAVLREKLARQIHEATTGEGPETDANKATAAAASLLYHLEAARGETPPGEQPYWAKSAGLGGLAFTHPEVSKSLREIEERRVSPKACLVKMDADPRFEALLKGKHAEVTKLAAQDAMLFSGRALPLPKEGATELVSLVEESLRLQLNEAADTKQARRKHALGVAKAPELRKHFPVVSGGIDWKQVLSDPDRFESAMAWLRTAYPKDFQGRFYWVMQREAAGFFRDSEATWAKWKQDEWSRASWNQGDWTNIIARGAEARRVVCDPKSDILALRKALGGNVGATSRELSHFSEDADYIQTSLTGVLKYIDALKESSDDLAKLRLDAVGKSLRKSIAELMRKQSDTGVVDMKPSIRQAFVKGNVAAWLAHTWGVGQAFESLANADDRTLRFLAAIEKHATWSKGAFGDLGPANGLEFDAKLMTFRPKERPPSGAPFKRSEISEGSLAKQVAADVDEWLAVVNGTADLASAKDLEAKKKFDDSKALLPKLGSWGFMGRINRFFHSAAEATEPYVARATSSLGGNGIWEMESLYREISKKARGNSEPVPKGVRENWAKYPSDMRAAALDALRAAQGLDRERAGVGKALLALFDTLPAGEVSLSDWEKNWKGRLQRWAPNVPVVDRLLRRQPNLTEAGLRSLLEMSASRAGELEHFLSGIPEWERDFYGALELKDDQWIVAKAISIPLPRPSMSEGAAKRLKALATEHEDEIADGVDDGKKGLSKENYGRAKTRQLARHWLEEEWRIKGGGEGKEAIEARVKEIASLEAKAKRSETEEARLGALYRKALRDQVGSTVLSRPARQAPPTSGDNDEEKEALRHAGDLAELSSALNAYRVYLGSPRLRWELAQNKARVMENTRLLYQHLEKERRVRAERAEKHKGDGVVLDDPRLASLKFLETTHAEFADLLERTIGRALHIPSSQSPHESFDIELGLASLKGVPLSALQGGHTVKTASAELQNLNYLDSLFLASDQIKQACRRPETVAYEVIVGNPEKVTGGGGPGGSSSVNYSKAGLTFKWGKESSQERGRSASVAGCSWLANICIDNLGQIKGSLADPVLYCDRRVNSGDIGAVAKNWGSLRDELDHCLCVMLKEITISRKSGIVEPTKYYSDNKGWIDRLMRAGTNRYRLSGLLDSRHATILAAGKGAEKVREHTRDLWKTVLEPGKNTQKRMAAGLEWLGKLKAKSADEYNELVSTLLNYPPGHQLRNLAAWHLAPPHIREVVKKGAAYLEDFDDEDVSRDQKELSKFMRLFEHAPREWLEREWGRNDLGHAEKDIVGKEGIDAERLRVAMHDLEAAVKKSERELDLPPSRSIGSELAPEKAYRKGLKLASKDVAEHYVRDTVDGFVKPWLESKEPIAFDSPKLNLSFDVLEDNQKGSSALRRSRAGKQDLEKANQHFLRELARIRRAQQNPKEAICLDEALGKLIWGKSAPKTFDDLKAEQKAQFGSLANALRAIVARGEDYIVQRYRQGGLGPDPKWDDWYSRTPSYAAVEASARKLADRGREALGCEDKAAPEEVPLVDAAKKFLRRPNDLADLLQKAGTKSNHQGERLGPQGQELADMEDFFERMGEWNKNKQAKKKGNAKDDAFERMMSRLPPPAKKKGEAKGRPQTHGEAVEELWEEAQTEAKLALRPYYGSGPLTERAWKDQTAIIKPTIQTSMMNLSIKSCCGQKVEHMGGDFARAYRRAETAEKSAPGQWLEKLADLTENSAAARPFLTSASAKSLTDLPPVYSEMMHFLLTRKIDPTSKAYAQVVELINSPWKGRIVNVLFYEHPTLAREFVAQLDSTLYAGAKGDELKKILPVEAQDKTNPLWALRRVPEAGAKERDEIRLAALTKLVALYQADKTVKLPDLSKLKKASELGAAIVSREITEARQQLAKMIADERTKNAGKRLVDLSVEDRAKQLLLMVIAVADRAGDTETGEMAAKLDAAKGLLHLDTAVGMAALGGRELSLRENKDHKDQVAQLEHVMTRFGDTKWNHGPGLGMATRLAILEMSPAELRTLKDFESLMADRLSGKDLGWTKWNDFRDVLRTLRSGADLGSTLVDHAPWLMAAEVYGSDDPVGRVAQAKEALLKGKAIDPTSEVGQHIEQLAAKRAALERAPKVTDDHRKQALEAYRDVVARDIIRTHLLKCREDSKGKKSLAECNQQFINEVNPAIKDAKGDDTAGKLNKVLGHDADLKANELLKGVYGAASGGEGETDLYDRLWRACTEDAKTASEGSSKVVETEEVKKLRRREQVLKAQLYGDGKDLEDALVSVNQVKGLIEQTDRQVGYLEDSKYEKKNEEIEKLGKVRVRLVAEEKRLRARINSLTQTLQKTSGGRSIAKIVDDIAKIRADLDAEAPPSAESVDSCFQKKLASVAETGLGRFADLDKLARLETVGTGAQKTWLSDLKALKTRQANFWKGRSIEKITQSDEVKDLFTRAKALGIGISDEGIRELLGLEGRDPRAFITLVQGRGQVFLDWRKRLETIGRSLTVLSDEDVAKDDALMGRPAVKAVVGIGESGIHDFRVDRKQALAMLREVRQQENGRVTNLKDVERLASKLGLSWQTLVGKLDLTKLSYVPSSGEKFEFVGGKKILENLKDDAECKPAKRCVVGYDPATFKKGLVELSIALYGKEDSQKLGDAFDEEVCRAWDKGRQRPLVRVNNYIAHVTWNEKDAKCDYTLFSGKDVAKMFREGQELVSESEKNFLKERVSLRRENNHTVFLDAWRATFGEDPRPGIEKAMDTSYVSAQKWMETLTALAPAVGTRDHEDKSLVGEGTPPHLWVASKSLQERFHVIGDTVENFDNISSDVAWKHGMAALTAIAFIATLPFGGSGGWILTALQGARMGLMLTQLQHAITNDILYQWDPTGENGLSQGATWSDAGPQGLWMAAEFALGGVIMRPFTAIGESVSSYRNIAQARGLDPSLLASHARTVARAGNGARLAGPALAEYQASVRYLEQLGLSSAEVIAEAGNIARYTNQASRLNKVGTFLHEHQTLNNMMGMGSASFALSMRKHIADSLRDGTPFDFGKAVGESTTHALHTSLFAMGADAKIAGMFNKGWGKVAGHSRLADSFGFMGSAVFAGGTNSGIGLLGHYTHKTPSQEMQLMGERADQQAQKYQIALAMVKEQLDGKLSAGDRDRLVEEQEKLKGLLEEAKGRASTYYKQAGDAEKQENGKQKWVKLLLTDRIMDYYFGIKGAVHARQHRAFDSYTRAIERGMGHEAAMHEFLADHRTTVLGGVLGGRGDLGATKLLNRLRGRRMSPEEAQTFQHAMMEHPHGAVLVRDLIDRSRGNREQRDSAEAALHNFMETLNGQILHPTGDPGHELGPTELRAVLTTLAERRPQEFQRGNLHELLPFIREITVERRMAELTGRDARGLTPTQRQARALRVLSISPDRWRDVAGQFPIDRLNPADPRHADFLARVAEAERGLNPAIDRYLANFIAGRRQRPRDWNGLLGEARELASGDASRRSGFVKQHDMSPDRMHAFLLTENTPAGRELARREYAAMLESYLERDTRTKDLPPDRRAEALRAILEAQFNSLNERIESYETARNQFLRGGRS